jgi:hypothetical protein
MLKYLQVQHWFDAEKIKAEVAQLEAGLWMQHYNKSHYEGGWTVLPLRSINGSPDNIVSVHASAGTANQYVDTALLESCPYIKTVLSFFACEKTAVRLMKLYAGAVINEHRDQEMSFEEGEVRFHIPVVTNPGVEFYLDGERVPMQEGECWYLNLSLKHRVSNTGTADRVHLVIDCKVNDWINNLFAQNAEVQKQIDNEQPTDHDAEAKRKIIRELRNLNTPTALALAEKMENELP